MVIPKRKKKDIVRDTQDQSDQEAIGVRKLPYKDLKMDYKQNKNSLSKK